MSPERCSTDPARRVALTLVGLLLLPGLIPVGQATTSSTGHEPMPEPNVLEVEATTGEILAWKDLDSPLTHVRIHEVAPRTEGFTLLDPQGREVFIDQLSRTDGVVEFWYVHLSEGLYTVIRHTDGLDEPVTAFQTTEVLEAGLLEQAGGLLMALLAPVAGLLDLFTGKAVASHGYQRTKEQDTPCFETYRGRVDCGQRCSYWTTERIDDADLWTPESILHAPYRGTGELTSYQTERTTRMVGPVGWESTMETSTGMQTSSGMSYGIFALLTWGLYEMTYYDNWCYPEARYHDTKVIDHRPKDNVPHWRTIDTWGESRRTDQDDATRVNRAGYDSIQFESIYAAPDGNITTENKTLSRTTGGASLSSLTAGIRFRSKTLTFSKFEVKATSSDGATFRYWFPENGTWLFDRLGGDDAGWAFCYAPRSTGC